MISTVLLILMTSYSLGHYMYNGNARERYHDMNPNYLTKSEYPEYAGERGTNNMLYTQYHVIHKRNPEMLNSISRFPLRMIQIG
ncbi:hypothetical protein GJ496_003914 [Pomphorhynchus laevis]|nr:hypothetical protein GJ496_003914 [Pomphorhynchus laevis]